MSDSKNKILISCQKATLLIEVHQATPLSFIDKTKLNFHVLICKACKQYEKQSIFIGKALFNRYKDNIDIIPSEELKEKVLLELSKKS